MAFRRRARQQRQTAQGFWPGRLLAYLVHLSMRAVLWTVIIGVVGSGLMYLRLSKGPLHLTFAVPVAVQMFNNSTDRMRVGLADLIFTLGAPGAPAGIQFIDLQVSSVEGEALFRIPRLAAKFDIGGLLQGKLRPTRIVVIGPKARLLQTRDGAFRFGLGAELSGDRLTPTSMVRETPQMAAIIRILDGLVGDIEPTPLLSHLRGIVISNADFVFENETNGRRWHSSRANFRIVRAENGLLARLSAGLSDGALIGARVVVSAERRRGDDGTTRVSMNFNQLRPEHLAEQLDQMQWLRLFDAPLNGTLSATILKDGQIKKLAGQISADEGQIFALKGHGQPFDSIDLSFAHEAGLERVQISEMVLASKALDTRLSGFIHLARDPGGAVSGLLGQFEIAGLRALVPTIFGETLQFDGGQVVARLDLDPLRIDVANAHLRNGGMVLDISGSARALGKGWKTDLRAAGRNLTVGQLVQHWPLIAAKNARKWVERNIVAGKVDNFVAALRLSDGKPQVNMDFAYSSLVSSYLKQMTPIREARGRGSLTQNTFDLILDGGEVTPVDGEPIQLGGSTMRIPNLRKKGGLAEITIRGTGPSGSIMTLIDEPPLGLLKKLGLDPRSIKGNSTVIAELSFPLITALKLEQVEVSANARLDDLQMPFHLPGGQMLDVVGDAVALRATKRALDIDGEVVIDGDPLSLSWHEGFGSNRAIDLKGPATPEMLDRFGVGNRYFSDGHMLMDLHLNQKDSSAYAFDMTADLGSARLDVEELGWFKAAGANGRLEIAGEYEDGARVSRFNLDTSELKAVGSIDFTKGGEVKSANFEQIKFLEYADVAIVANQTGAPDGGYSLKVNGNYLDLAMFSDDTNAVPDDNRNSGPDISMPMEVEFDLKNLTLTPNLVSRPGTGTFDRDGSGNVTARLEGLLAAQVPFSAEYARADNAPGEITLLADDAGALLKASGLFMGATGGRLRLKAQIAPEEDVILIGHAKIKDVRISGTSTFKSILEEGGAKEAASAAEGGGLAFDKVKIPFEYRDRMLILGDTTAKGQMLAVKVEGTVDEAEDKLDLVGVISPAYALTGMLDSIPLIGDILSGGKGEGILAMTFSVKGSLDEPDISVNPLSLLTPGILRSIFSGRNKQINEKFLERIKREVD